MNLRSSYNNVSDQTNPAVLRNTNPHFILL